MPEAVLTETRRIAAPRSHRSCSYGGTPSRIVSCRLCGMPVAADATSCP